MNDRDRLLKSFRRERRRIQRESWFRGVWRDTLAWLFSREARQEQRRWKQEAEDELMKIKKEQDEIWNKIQRERGLTDEDKS